MGGAPAGPPITLERLQRKLLIAPPPALEGQRRQHAFLGHPGWDPGPHHEQTTPSNPKSVHRSHPGAGTEVFGARFCQAFRPSARRSVIVVSLADNQQDTAYGLAALSHRTWLRQLSLAWWRQRNSSSVSTTRLIASRRLGRLLSEVSSRP